LRQYETTFVIDSLLKNDEIDEIVKRYERFISANGGSIIEIQHWGKKRLAYEIRKRQYGYFVYIRFEGPGSVVKPLEREFILNESILRYLTIALTKQALKAETVRKEKQKIAQEKEREQKAEKKKQDTKNDSIEEIKEGTSPAEEATSDKAPEETKTVEIDAPKTQEDNAEIHEEAQEEVKKAEGDTPPPEEIESDDKKEPENEE